ncbi:MAG: hypothetical protein HYZ27_05260, partial [Deltaproteobacteria bacterium]|nr:hypothetical protein [Deltaproteobacteria bacterium]
MQRVHPGAAAVMPESELATPGAIREGDDRHLMQRCQTGEAAAFVALVLRFRRPVYGYLVRCGVESSVRDDLFQDIFLKIHRAAGVYQSERPLAPWIFTIVANTVRSHFRKMRLRRLVTPAPVDPQDPAASSEQIAEAHDVARQIERAL